MHAWLRENPTGVDALKWKGAAHGAAESRRSAP